MNINAYFPSRLAGLATSLSNALMGKLGTNHIRYCPPNTSENRLTISHVELPPELIQKIFNEMATGTKINFKNTCKTLNNASKLSLSLKEKYVVVAARTMNTLTDYWILELNGFCSTDQVKAKLDEHLNNVLRTQNCTQKMIALEDLNKRYRFLALQYYDQNDLLKAESCLAKAYDLDMYELKYKHPNWATLEVGETLFKYYFELNEFEQCLRIEHYLDDCKSSERFFPLIQKAYNLNRLVLTFEILKVYLKRQECRERFKICGPFLIKALNDQNQAIQSI